MSAEDGAISIAAAHARIQVIVRVLSGVPSGDRLAVVTALAAAAPSFRGVEAEVAALREASAALNRKLGDIARAQETEPQGRPH